MKRKFDLQACQKSIKDKLGEIERRLAVIHSHSKRPEINRDKPLIFLGPSLEVSIASKMIDADFRPPIARGDLPQALEEGYRFVGIIDGVFHQALTVSIQEIRYAIEKGVKIYGSSSMGALRAAEAYPLGMIGVGEIYQWYRDEKIDSDDEVAVGFDEKTGQGITVPLVNIRATLNRALQGGMLDPALAEKVLQATFQLPFPQRTYANICSLLKETLPFLTVEKINKIFLENGFDLKAEDAKALLLRMKEDYATLNASRAE